MSTSERTMTISRGIEQSNEKMDSEPDIVDANSLNEDAGALNEDDRPLGATSEDETDSVSGTLREGERKSDNLDSPIPGDVETQNLEISPENENHLDIWNNMKQTNNDVSLNPRNENDAENSRSGESPGSIPEDVGHGDEMDLEAPSNGNEDHIQLENDNLSVNETESASNLMNTENTEAQETANNTSNSPDQDKILGSNTGAFPNWNSTGTNQTESHVEPTGGAIDGAPSEMEETLQESNLGPGNSTINDVTILDESESEGQVFEKGEETDQQEAENVEAKEQAVVDSSPNQENSTVVDLEAEVGENIWQDGMQASSAGGIGGEDETEEGVDTSDHEIDWTGENDTDSQTSPHPVPSPLAGNNQPTLPRWDDRAPTFALSESTTTLFDDKTTSSHAHSLGFFVAVAMVPILLLCICRRFCCSGKQDSRGEYRAVAARYGDMSFDNTFSDNFSDEELEGDPEEAWGKSGKRVMEMGSVTNGDRLSLEEVNG